MSKRALVLGIGGQDGSYAAEMLLDKGYEVHGLHRRTSLGNLERIGHLLSRVTLHHGDLADAGSVARILFLEKYDEVYNFADQDHIGWSYATPDYSLDVTAGAVGRMLEMLHQNTPSVRFFQPISATVFGTASPPQDEDTPFAPQSPYACAKALAYYLCRHYRREYGMHVSTAIYYNHDSPRRKGDYLLHKVCRAAAAVARGEQKTLELGDPNIQVDVGYAPEYVEAAWRIVQQAMPDDFVIGTGDTWTVREIARHAFQCVGLVLDNHLVVTPFLVRPGQPPFLLGDTRKAQRVLDWQPRVDTGALVEMLVKHYQEVPRCG